MAIVWIWKRKTYRHPIFSFYRDSQFWQCARHHRHREAELRWWWSFSNQQKVSNVISWLARHWYKYTCTPVDATSFGSALHTILLRNILPGICGFAIYNLHRSSGIISATSGSRAAAWASSTMFPTVLLPWTLFFAFYCLFLLSSF
jgi:hypothetical protein